MQTLPRPAWPTPFRIPVRLMLIPVARVEQRALPVVCLPRIPAKILVFPRDSKVGVSQFSLAHVCRLISCRVTPGRPSPFAATQTGAKPDSRRRHGQRPDAIQQNPRAAHHAQTGREKATERDEGYVRGDACQAATESNCKNEQVGHFESR